MRIDTKQIVSVVGPNGAGKSTLLKTVSGLIKPKSGVVTFLNERIDNLPDYQIVRKGIVRVPEGRNVFPQMTTLENLELGAIIDRAKKQRKGNLQMVFDLFLTLFHEFNGVFVEFIHVKVIILGDGRWCLLHSLLW